MRRYEGIKPSKEVQPVLPAAKVARKRPDELGPNLPKEEPASPPDLNDTFETTLAHELANLPDTQYPTYDKDGNLLPKSRSQE
jgi:hypothetical protein